MTRKDYRLIAAAIRAVYTEDFREGLDLTALVDGVRALVPVFQIDNPNFDADCFLKAALGE